MADQMECASGRAMLKTPLTIKRLTMDDFLRLRSKLKPAVYNKALDQLSVSSRSSDEEWAEPESTNSNSMNVSFNGN